MARTTTLYVCALIVAALSVAAAAQTGQFSGTNGPATMRIGKVFLNVTGDQKLVRRVLTFFDLELEDTGIKTVNTEVDADAEIDADVNLAIDTSNLGIGILKWSTTKAGKTDTTRTCESLGTPEDGEFFASSSEGLATDLRKRYPDARTVKIDPGSDTAASKLFPYQLPGALKASEFTVVDSGTADVTLRVDLTREKVPVEEHVVRYKINVILRNGSRPIYSDGTGVISAKATSVPELCPERVSDMDWLVGTDALFGMVERSVKQLRMNNRKASSSKK